MLDDPVVKRLLEFRARVAPVLSLYLGVPRDPGDFRAAESQLHALLKPARELAESDDLGHYERESLRTDLARVAELATRTREFQGRGVAVIACARAELYEEVALPRAVRDQAIVDATPYLRPLLITLGASHRYCVAVVARNDSWLYDFFDRELEAAETVDDPKRPSKSADERHIHHREELAAHQHYRHTVEALEKMVHESGAELVVLGGHEETVAEFLRSMPHDLQPLVAGTFVIDPHTMTRAQVREHAETIVDAHEREEKARLMNEVLEKVATGGFGALGLEWCLLAVNEKAVEILFVTDDAHEPGRACDNCGWLGLAGEECPVCGQPTRETPDVIDDMCEAVVAAGGRVIGAETDTAPAPEMVAARLRFPVPRPVATGSG